MNIYQMQALDYVLKQSKYRNNLDFSYKIIFRLDNELYSGDFVETNDKGHILESPSVLPMGQINQDPFYYDYAEESPIKRADLKVYPNQGGPMSRKIEALISNGVSLPSIHKSLLEVIENTEGSNKLDPIVYNVESLTYGYKLPHLLVNESAEFEWISLDKTEN